MELLEIVIIEFHSLQRPYFFTDVGLILSNVAYFYHRHAHQVFDTI